MAEMLFRDALNARGLAIEVTSAGVGAIDGKAIDPSAVKLMQERGIDAAAHRSAQYSPIVGLENDLILVMTEDMRDLVVGECPPLHGRVYRLGHWDNYDISDPHMRGEASFRKALKLIDSGVAEWLERIG